MLVLMRCRRLLEALGEVDRESGACVCVLQWHSRNEMLAVGTGTALNSCRVSMGRKLETDWKL